VERTEAPEIGIFKTFKCVHMTRQKQKYWCEKFKFTWLLHTARNGKTL